VTRTLRLAKETLAELTTDDLTRVGGGAVSGVTCLNCGSDFAPCYPTYRCQTLDCVVTLKTCM
jgi:hypothetical protein